MYISENKKIYKLQELANFNNNLFFRGIKQIICALRGELFFSTCKSFS